ncbi:molybdate ABC transporter substrate-binding protein [Fodinisporobacter ferrooxydans]|uniref:Molybdate ABC transporter substrate-binding protein n=1 Tax=Fodinisporobacter ferrooxydans TaxID=2901836 RepID=A0ABY4CIQ6_9BACL|nr:molybdate ABC transporter substrate-binding protein [Alicyclobacillaceae bacterium MYW30-H2]
MLSCKLKKQLRDFTLDIQIELQRKTLVLIGHSGCGKTTTLQMLAGLANPEQGYIKLDGAVLFENGTNVNIPVERRKIGYVFQNYALFPHLSVADNIAYGIQYLPQAEQAARVNEMLELMQLTPLADEKPGVLSGGQEQRVALARALVTRPQLLLLDEPLSALDVSTRGHVRTELKSLLDTLSIPCIVVTHDYEDARVLGDEIAVMDRGLVVQKGMPQDINRMPANRFVAQFTGTNLVTEGSGAIDRGVERLRQISFDPWHVTISRTLRNSQYEWSGKIDDKAVLGGFIRFSINGGVPLIADLTIDEGQVMDYQIGDEVFVQVDEANIRRYVVDLPREIAAAEIRHTQKSEKSFRQKKGSRADAAGNLSPMLWRPKSKWRWFGTPIVAVFGMILAAGTISGFQMYRSSHQATGSNVAKAVNGKNQKLTAFVAANATDPFNTLIQMFAKQHPGISVQPSYAGTQVLQTQLEQGAPDDIFLSANRSHADELVKEGLVKQFYPVSRDHEVIVVPKANPAGIHSLQDLGTKPLKLIIGVPSVPIGQYTRQIFKNGNETYGAGFSAAAMGHVVSMETNVKQILEKVALGEGDAGIVYVTDVTPEFTSRLRIISIPKPYNVIATNYVGIPKNSQYPQLAKDFLALMRSPEGQGVFRQFGYDPLSSGGSAK